MLRQMLAGAIVGIVMTLGLPNAARAQTPDPEFRADIEQLLDATGAAKMGAQMGALIGNSFLAELKRSNPDIPDRAVTIVRDVMDAEMSKMYAGPNGIMPDMVDLYAKHFTHEDVIALLAFYRSPVGQKTIEAMPLLLQEGAVIGQRWMQMEMPNIANAVHQRLQTEGLVP